MPKHDAGQQYTDKQLALLTKRINAIYSDAEKDMQAKLDEFTAKHQVKNRIHLQELADGKITQDDYDAWMRGQVFQGNQWAAKRAQLADVLYNANKEAVDILNGGTISVLAQNANFMAYTLEHGAGVNFGFGLYDANAVTNLLKNDPNILPFKKLDKTKDKRWNFQKIRNQITQGIIQGERLDQIAKRLSTVTGSQNKRQMMTHARTAMTSAQNAGRQIRLEDAKKLGIKLKKEWMATFDLHTRDAHRELDGQKVDIDKPFKVDGYEIRFPADPHAQPYLVYNCRCTMVADIDDYPEEYQRYDNIDGVPVDQMTYKEWYDAKHSIQPAEVGNSTMRIDAYVTKIIATLEKQDSEKFLKLLNDCPDENMRNVYQVYADKINQITKTKNGGQFIPWSNSIDYSLQTKYDDLNDFETLTHEMGHFFDRCLGKDVNLTYKEVDAINKAMTPPWGLRSMAEKRINSGRASMSDEFLSAIRKDKQQLSFMMDEFSISFKDFKADVRMTNASSGLQDATDGFFSTQSKGIFRWGHGDRYYNRNWNDYVKGKYETEVKNTYKALGFDATSQAKCKNIMRDYETASEAWANIASAVACNDESLRYMQKYMPNSVAAFKSIIGRL